MLMGLSPRKMFWSRSMVTTRRCSVISFTVRVLGMLTSIPDCKTGAVIMKMTSSTSTTSTSGVMLMSASEDSGAAVVSRESHVLPLAAALRAAAVPASAHGNLFQRVQQFAAEVVHGRSKDANTCGELVVGHDGRDSHEQAGGSGNQRFAMPGATARRVAAPAVPSP